MLAKVIFVSIYIGIRFFFILLSVLFFLLFFFSPKVIDFDVLFFSDTAIASG